jgi:hypothetical protein
MSENQAKIQNEATRSCGLGGSSCSLLRVLVACEYSGTVRDAFVALGHDAMSCDILPTDSPGNHYQGDVRDVMNDGWDMMICHPPCTYLSVSGIHWNNRGRGWGETEKALDFVRLLMGANIPRIALENPVSIISSKIRKPDQIIQPHQYGHDASKATCLWLKNLPKLTATESIQPRIVNGKTRWANQTDGGQNKLPPSKDRWKLRSTTYKGIAEAMANQWSAYALLQRANSQSVNAAGNLGALFAWNTIATANASDHATTKMKDGNSKNEAESSTEYELAHR